MSSKGKGGLGVRDVRVVNVSLLAKWKWRLLQNDRALWKDVLVGKYGSNVLTPMDWQSLNWSYCASRWWLDLVFLKVGNGGSIGFCR